MAHHVEPMDIDSSVCDFDDKENSFHHNNVLPRTPCTEKGYEELDVSELNMKLRYSITPAASPMSKSYTANCLDNQNNETGDTLDLENGNMTRSLHSTLTKNDTIIKTQNSLPLQALSTDNNQIGDGNRNVLQPLDSTTMANNVTVMVTGPNDIEDNLSLPSSSSSIVHTPEATTPTKEMQKDGGSPIMRGLKSVFSMFRPSQSPIPPDIEQLKEEAVSPPIVHSPNGSDKTQAASASTPLTALKTKDPLAKRNSPAKDSLVFNEDLETELEWKDDSIVFGKEKIPISKLFFQIPNHSASKTNTDTAKTVDNSEKPSENMNETLEYMEISYNDFGTMGKSAVKIPDMNTSEAAATESDGEFVDAESTIKSESQFEQSYTSEDNDAISIQESHPNHIVQQDMFNVTTETLSASISNSGDLSSASTETTKAIETAVEKSTVMEEIRNGVQPDIAQEKKIEEINTKVIGKLDFIPSVDIVAPPINVSNSLHNTVVEEPISAADDTVKSSVDNMTVKIIKDNIEVGLSPCTDNVVVSSLSQIPLIADPRVLLFNLSPAPENKEKNHEAFNVECLNTSPADVPLPDDDDIASLPSMNCTLDTISQALDKISEEIPKLNQQAVEHEIMQTATSDEKLLDLTLSNLPGSESQESTTLDKSKKVEISLIPVEKSVLSTPVATPDDKQLAAIGHEKDTEAIEPISQPISVEEEVLSKPDVKLDETQAVINAIEELIPAQANTCREFLSMHDVEPMDISMAEVPSAYQSKIDMEHLANDIACILEGENIPIQKETETKFKEEQGEQHIQDSTKKEIVNEVLSNKINVLTEPASQVSFLLKDQKATAFAGEKTEKPDSLLNGTNVEIIKHEVEAIIDNAVDIVMEKIVAGRETIVKGHTNTLQDGQTKFSEDIINISEINLNIYNSTSNVSQVSVAPAATNTVHYEAAEATCEEPILKVVCSDCPPLSDIKVNEIMVKAPPDIEKIERNVIDEETLNITDEKIFTSENNSPFVLVCKEQLLDAIPLMKFEEIENPYVAESKVAASPPASPAIVSKGYNFNFDEIEDPFATNAKIRTSPPLRESPNRTFQQSDSKNKTLPKKENKNVKRKSQPEKKKPVASNTNLKSTIAGNHKTPDKSDAHPQLTVAETIESTVLQFKLEDDLSTNIMKSHIKDAPNENDKEAEIPYKANETTIFIKEVTNKNKESQSLEQSAYFSAVTSSFEEVLPKNNFDYPDLDNPDLNPFATKSKVCQTPPPEVTDINPFAPRAKICQTPPPALIEDPFATKSLIGSSTESSLTHDTEMPAVNTNINTDPEQEMAVSTIEKDLENLNSTTTSSMKNEKDNSINTVNTEDEDTIEGPFLEAEELNNEDKVSEFDNVDMMQFSDLPIGNEANTEAGEMFIDAEAFEFLLNQNQTNTVADSGKESLFLKFDPLFAKRVSSDGILSALNRVHKKQSTLKKKEKTVLSKDATFDISPVPGPSPKSAERPPLPKDATFDKSSIRGPYTPIGIERAPLPKDTTFDKSPIPGPSTPIVAERPPLLKDATFDKSPIPGPSKLNTTHELDVQNATDDSCDDLNVTVSKPMMVVNPAVNAVVTPRNKSLTPVRSNRQSLTFTSPAIAVIDRLLSMSSANNSFMNHDTTVAEVHQDNEADFALTQLRELLADKEISVYNLRTETKELQNRLATMESQMKTLETIGEQRLKKINELNERLDEKIKHNKSMAKVVEEYERTIASLIAETEQDKLQHAEEKAQLIRERDEQTAHLASMEISFNDLHSKYEKSKQVILGFKANEDLYKKSIKEFNENLTKMQKNYELLKQHATTKLNYANEELQKINRSHESEVLKLNALIKRKELHITSLEETLQQKTKANEELTAICDELINKVG